MFLYDDLSLKRKLNANPSFKAAVLQMLKNKKMKENKINGYVEWRNLLLLTP